ncbi:hypothetical protein MLD38_025207 [Melastoma candidum]|uniref:Uncharacterized protein n=1 Tax=Melastoma candidum TaxID=119954 RepID=A0ACB9NUR8_9MYRT|nr:hypothetical protein MLD38_025207 [Melastoma candidum]
MSGQSEGTDPAAGRPVSRAARRRRMEILRAKSVGGSEDSPHLSTLVSKRMKLVSDQKVEKVAAGLTRAAWSSGSLSENTVALDSLGDKYPKYGASSVCGRRREMEDAFTIRPFFVDRDDQATSGWHYFGVYDGHGCSHVAVRCGERMHELIKEELIGGNREWKVAMERSFCRMDKEVMVCNTGSFPGETVCRCKLQSPECDAIGSTAVLAIITPDKIIVANCGDSRAVLSRKGRAIPLSSDHKPDRPDELDRIHAAGGRVIYWDGPRVLGVLAMSRAIGDSYLKPYVSCEPEVTITDRTADDDCLILASDGLWDAVSNDTACGVARMCLKGKMDAPTCEPMETVRHGKHEGTEAERSDRACSDASMLLTKLALARHSTDNVSVVVVDLRRST